VEINKVQYRLMFQDQTEKSYELHLHADSLAPIGWTPNKPPEWAALDHHKCSNCPLNSAEHAYCPASLSLAPLVESSNDMDLLDTVKLVVRTNDRAVAVSATVQKALGSFIGLLMATSDCPRAAPFRPLARFHLPLATEEETVYRAVTSYAMAQFILRQEGMESSADLEGLYDIYRELEVVNTALASRLKTAGLEGAISKSLMEWDVFSGMFPIRAEDIIKHMRPLFTAYLGDLTK